VAKYMGDGVLVYFGYPQAHEDDAERAVRGGLEVISAVSALKVNRVTGEIALQCPGRDTAAETYFDRALTVARKQQAKSLELRAAMSMARLWRDQGKRDEACELLAPVYDWFSEGFDTLDLRDAKKLLDELSA
jgi:predicted ATPase